MTKQILRNKVLVVPYVMSCTFEPHFVMVKDRQTNEWGFISGGVKKNESPIQAAYREVKEETSGVLNLALRPNGFKFVTSYRPPELLMIDKRRNEIVHSLYTMYVVPCTSWDISRLQAFAPNNEIIDVRVAPFRDFHHVWTFCEDVYHKHVVKQVLKESRSQHMKPHTDVCQTNKSPAIVSQQDQADTVESVCHRHVRVGGYRCGTGW
jgi:8-oxo-dGTP pyrophosphatase MutT (NUDIX family)